MTMYQYSNDAYNSADTLPHNRFRYNDGPNHSETIGIGYYGVSRNNQIKTAKPEMASVTQTQGGSSLMSPTSPSSVRPLDNSAEHSSYLWNYMHEGVDLSPQGSNARTSRSNLKSPTRPLSEGSMLEAYNRSQISSNQRPGSNSVPALGYSEYSPQSTEQSSHSFIEYPLLRKQSGIGSPTVSQAPMSLRARWEQSHRPSVQKSQMPKTQLSSDSLSRSLRSNKDLSADASRLSDGDKLNRRCFSNINADQSPQSTLERDYNTYSTSSSLRRNPLSHQKLTNGSIRVAHDGTLHASRRSLNISRLSLRSQAGKATLYGKGYGVHNSLVNMGLAALLSLIMCYLSIQLLFRVSTRQGNYLFSTDSVLSSNVSHANVSEVVVALTSIAIMLDLCCLLTCVLQGYFAAKLMKCKQGQERAFHYLKECMPTRFIAIIGFFFSVPAFFFGLMLYIIMEYRSTAAIIAVVVLTIGVSFCISMASHSTYMWFSEKSHANKDLPVVFSERNNNKTKVVNGELTNQSELSTLV